MHENLPFLPFGKRKQFILHSKYQKANFVMSVLPTIKDVINVKIQNLYYVVMATFLNAWFFAVFRVYFTKRWKAEITRARAFKKQETDSLVVASLASFESLLFISLLQLLFLLSLFSGPVLIFFFHWSIVITLHFLLFGQTLLKAIL